MERFRYALRTKLDGSFAYGNDLEEMKEICDFYRSNGYPDCVVVINATDEPIYPTK